MLESIKFIDLHDGEYTVGGKIKNQICRLTNHRNMKKKKKHPSEYQQIYQQQKSPKIILKQSCPSCCWQDKTQKTSTIFKSAWIEKANGRKYNYTLITKTVKRFFKPKTVSDHNNIGKKLPKTH